MANQPEKEMSREARTGRSGEEVENMAFLAALAIILALVTPGHAKYPTITAPAPVVRTR